MYYSPPLHPSLFRYSERGLCGVIGGFRHWAICEFPNYLAPFFPRYLACPNRAPQFLAANDWAQTAPMRQISETIACHLSWKFTIFCWEFPRHHNRFSRRSVGFTLRIIWHSQFQSHSQRRWIFDRVFEPSPSLEPSRSWPVGISDHEIQSETGPRSSAV
jgi:hypothetical protein